MNFYAFHLGDYASATAHLSWDEDMAYRRLIDAYYQRESPLPLERRMVYRLARAATEEQRFAIDSVLEEFFVETEEGYRHYRCDAEIDATASKRAKASNSAKVRWAKENANAMRTHSERNANASDKACERIENGCEGNAPNPIPNPIPNKTKTLVHENPCTDTFELFWQRYPRKTAKQNALKAWEKIRPDQPLFEVITAAVKIQSQSEAWVKDGGSFIPHAATWLNGKRWEDEVIPAGKVHAFPGQSRHTGFDQRDYTDGLGAKRKDGSYEI